MSMNDPIADMLTRIRNAVQRQHQAVSIPYSRLKENIANVLKDEGYIESFEVIPEKPQSVLRLKLKYVGDRRNRQPVITAIERISRPDDVFMWENPKFLGFLVGWVLPFSLRLRV